MVRPVLTPLDGVAIVSTDEIADSAITEAKIGAAAVSNAKLAADAVTTSKVAAAQITAAKVANDTLTDTQMSAANKLNVVWITLTITGPWTGSVLYTKHGNVVFVYLDLTNTGVANPVVGQLPVGYRPWFTARFPSRTFISSSGASSSIVTIDSNGNIESLATGGGIAVTANFHSLIL